ncbi:MAG: DUF1330 domain-containing protein [Myxococcales bacterium]|nr:DUF1330 domain-containing protein [Myxococcales bacterium]
MPAYIVARVDVTDPDKYKNYMALTPAAIEKAGGRFVVRGGAITTLEGPEETRRLVILEFDSIEKAKAFYHSPDYERAKREREGAAEAQFIAVEGV